MFSSIPTTPFNLTLWSQVKASFKSVLSSFLHPHSYTLDIDRLLLGAESSSRTEHIGVLHIIFHGARDLPKADTMGSCDPYLKVGFEKAKKVMFSTRTIGRSRNPLWEEECFCKPPHPLPSFLIF